MWEITVGDNKCYLFGSIFLGNENAYPLPEAVEQAFADSKTLVIPALPEGMSPAHIHFFVEANGVCTAGYLVDQVSAETAELVRAYCAETGLSFKKTNRLKPWAAYWYIGENEIKRSGLDSKKGVDKHFLKQAKAAKKPILELESQRDQMETIARFDARIQELMLLDALLEAKKPKSIEKLVDAWKSGDVDRLNEVYFIEPLANEPRLHDYYTKFFYEHNIKIVAKMEKHLKSADPAFIMIDVSHLPGEKGILKLLADKGYSIKQICGKR